MNSTLVRPDRIPRLFAAAILVLGADLVSKSIATRALDGGAIRWLIDGVIGFELTENSGVAFGIGGGSRVVTALAIGGLIALVWFVLRSGLAGHPVGAGAFGMCLGGAIANLIDRVPDGTVTDFFVVGPWPRFNVADSGLTLGLLALLVVEIRMHGGFQGV